MDDRLYRSRHERMISGVAGGLAERLDVDPSIVRVIWVLLVLPTGFLALLAYVVMAIVVPEEPPAEATVAEAVVAESATAGGPTALPAAQVAPTAQAWADPRAQRRAEREARRAARRAVGGNGAVILGGILVVVGALFLARQFLPELDIDLLWPIVLMVIGVALVLGSVRRT
jgi:phage shock protein C